VNSILPKKFTDRMENIFCRLWKFKRFWLVR